MRRSAFLVFLLALGLIGFGGTYWLLNSPYYSLYQIGKAIYHHDAPLFLAYVDLDEIVNSQQSEFVDIFLPKDQTGDAHKVVSTLLAVMMPQVSRLIKARVVEEIRNPKRNNLPNSYVLALGADVSLENDIAQVLLQDPTKPEKKLRMSMRTNPEQGHWQVVRINPQDLKALLADELKKKLAN